MTCITPPPLPSLQATMTAAIPHPRPLSFNNHDTKPLPHPCTSPQATMPTTGTATPTSSPQATVTEPYITPPP